MDSVKRARKFRSMIKAAISLAPDDGEAEELREMLKRTERYQIQGSAKSGFKIVDTWGGKLTISGFTKQKDAAFDANSLNQKEAAFLNPHS